MPQVTAQLSLVDGADADVTTSTSSFAFGSSESQRLRLFESCDDEGTEPGCCAYGSRECVVPLSRARTDGPVLSRSQATFMPALLATVTLH
jgi:hypothetical protein